MTEKLREIFAGVAPTYERVNRVLTLGLDARWRRSAARLAARGGGTLWLDVCSGTGDMAREMRRRLPAGARVVALDFCAPMLGRAVARAAESGPFEFVLADVKALPFREGTFDAITMSFATRNINLSAAVLEGTFREFRRVLKPGGRFVNLETSQPPAGLVRFLFRLYVKAFVRPVGRRLSGSDPGYAYLSSTIPRFYGAEELSAILSRSGFSGVSFRRLFWGAAAVHVAVK